jgi:hypothetical protein
VFTKGQYRKQHTITNKKESPYCCEEQINNSTKTTLYSKENYFRDLVKRNAKRLKAALIALITI